MSQYHGAMDPLGLLDSPLGSPQYVVDFKPSPTFPTYRIAAGDEVVLHADGVELRVVIDKVGPDDALFGTVRAVDNKKERSAKYRGIADGSRIDFKQRNVFICAKRV